MNKPRATIVVVPRERFSYSRQSLESIYANTKFPFDLVYVDGNSPKNVREYLAVKSQSHNFKLIRTERYLSPNQARNIGLSKVNTEYTVFVDNDVYVHPGWLKKLVNCAEGTDAAVVSPLVCIGNDLTGNISSATCLAAGGEVKTYLAISKHSCERKLDYQYYFANCSLTKIKDKLQRRECELAKFHTMLVRTDIFTTIGRLDEKLLSRREHIDFCLSVVNARKKIYCEPTSIVSYVPAKNLALSDLPYFELRWSDAWELSSLKHFNRKWSLTEKQESAYQLGYRRHQTLLQPIVKRLSFGGYATWLENILAAGERKINRSISDRHNTIDLPLIDYDKSSISY